MIDHLAQLTIKIASALACVGNNPTNKGHSMHASIRPDAELSLLLAAEIIRSSGYRSLSSTS